MERSFRQKGELAPGRFLLHPIGQADGATPFDFAAHRAFADFCFASVVLHVFMFNFLG